MSISALLSALASCAPPARSAVAVPTANAGLPSAPASSTKAASAPSAETQPTLSALTAAGAVDLVTDAHLLAVSPRDLASKLRPYLPLHPSNESEGQLDLEGQNSAAQLVQASFMKSGGTAPPSFLQLALSFRCSQQTSAACLDDFRLRLVQRLGQPVVLNQDPKTLLWHQAYRDITLQVPESTKTPGAPDPAPSIRLSVAVPQGEAD